MPPRRGTHNTHPERHRMCDAEARHVPCPEWSEVPVEADLTAAVHLLRLAVELGQRELGRHVGIGYRQVKFKVVLVLEAIVEVPHLARPPRAGLVTLYGEPLVACTRATQGQLGLWLPRGRRQRRRRRRARGLSPASLLIRWYSMRARYSSFTRAIHSASEGTAAL